MFSDLVSVASHIYKYGNNDSLPGEASGKGAINLHADEFNELIGDEFIPMINKGRGAGLKVTAYNQTLSDIEAKIGNRGKAGQIIGNFNNLNNLNSLFMLRVRETATAEFFINQVTPPTARPPSPQTSTTSSAPPARPCWSLLMRWAYPGASTTR